MSKLLDEMRYFGEIGTKKRFTEKLNKRLHCLI